MKKIPEKLRNEMANDPYYSKCCLAPFLYGTCGGRIEWHHNLIYGGSQLNAKFCILPLCDTHHRNIVKYKELCDWIMLYRATDKEIEDISKATPYARIRQYLTKKFGKYTQI